MKLKAVLPQGRGELLASAVESDTFDTRVIKEVLIRHLHMRSGVGPAEFYIQDCDYANGRRGMFCEARLTGVSVNSKRAPDDFYNARAALERVYAQTLHPLLSRGEKLQLMISIMTDKPPKDGASSLVERSGRDPTVTIVGGMPLSPDLLREDEGLEA